mgnify:CR=1 FL=1
MSDHPSDHKHIVIIGATSGIAGQCARRWANTASRITLVARNRQALDEIAADLIVRNPALHIDCVEGEFMQPEGIRAMTDSIIASAPVDIVLIAHGNLPDQSLCQQDLSACADAIRVNALSPALIAEAFAAHMASTGRGTIAVIGSVAGDRGRKSNYVYGAAKGLVTRYCQGLQHRFAGTGVRVVLIKPGPTDTAMTAHLKQQGARLASADEVADCIVDGIERGKPVIYAPGKWALIMMIIRHLPRFVFNRMDI